MLTRLLQMKPVMLAAIVIVLVLGAVLLALPILVGSGASGYPIAKGDRIAAWSWKGVYLDGAQNQADTDSQITKLKSELGKGAADYDIDIGIASEYELLGDGKNAYGYLSKAIALDKTKGLAYMNMGHLMEELGAFATAHAAYDAAVAAEPNSAIYQASRQNFLIHHPGA